jgi:2-polyprenyl-3-methyl-5-hydroxy-6-metoxy-1,4-benzoquinol methylase
MTTVICGTQGYAQQAADLIERYETASFIEKHKAVLHLIPPGPSRVLDIGAGTGADAAWLANRGHNVLAVEPTDEFRSYGIAHHASPLIEWLDDSLPRLEQVVQRQQTFSVVLLTAVWMHLDEMARSLAMPIVASLLAPGGLLMMSLRHGPVPRGRLMFEVQASEAIAGAVGCGLTALLNVERASVQPANRALGVMWSHLAFARDGGSARG